MRVAIFVIWIKTTGADRLTDSMQTPALQCRMSWDACGWSGFELST